MGKQICNGICLASITPQEFSQLEKKQYFYFMDGKLDRRVTQFTPTLSSGAEIELRPDNYVWALVARQHI